MHIQIPLHRETQGTQDIILAGILPENTIVARAVRQLLLITQLDRRGFSNIKNMINLGYIPCFCHSSNRVMSYCYRL